MNSDVINEIATRILRKIFLYKESVIRETITERLGEDWKIEALKDRLQCVVYPDIECYYLDGKLLKAFPTKFSQVKDESDITRASTTYQKVLTYEEAFLIIQTHNAKIVSWPWPPFTEEQNYWTLLVQEEL